MTAATASASMSQSQLLLAPAETYIAGSTGVKCGECPERWARDDPGDESMSFFVQIVAVAMRALD